MEILSVFAINYSSFCYYNFVKGTNDDGENDKWHKMNKTVSSHIAKQ